MVIFLGCDRKKKCNVYKVLRYSSGNGMTQRCTVTEVLKQKEYINSVPRILIKEFSTLLICKSYIFPSRGCFVRGISA